MTPIEQAIEALEAAVSDDQPYIFKCKLALAALRAQPAQIREPNITEDDYQHFLSYSGILHSDWLRYAYFHGADVDCNKPLAALRAQPDHSELVKRLRLGASISRERRLNLDFAKIADEAADALEGKV